MHLQVQDAEEDRESSPESLQDDIESASPMDNLRQPGSSTDSYEMQSETDK